MLGHVRDLLIGLKQIYTDYEQLEIREQYIVKMPWGGGLNFKCSGGLTLKQWGINLEAEGGLTLRLVFTFI